MLRQVLGKETYSREVHIAWVKIYNRMIRTIVPVAVALELNTGPSIVHNQRLASYAANMFSEENSSSTIAITSNPTTVARDTQHLETTVEGMVEDDSEPLISEKIRKKATEIREPIASGVHKSTFS